MFRSAGENRNTSESMLGAASDPTRTALSEARSVDLEGQTRPTRVQNLVGGGVRWCRMPTPRIEKVRSRPTTARIPLGPPLEHQADIHLAFLQLGCALISLRLLG